MTNKDNILEIDKQTKIKNSIDLKINNPFDNLDLEWLHIIGPFSGEKLPSHFNKCFPNIYIPLI